MIKLDTTFMTSGGADLGVALRWSVLHSTAGA